MAARLTSISLFVLLITHFASAYAGSIYKCKLEDGSTMFTSVDCPQSTLEREYKGEYAKKQNQQNSTYREPSLIAQQIQRLEQRQAIERQIKHSQTKALKQPTPKYKPNKTYSDSGSRLYKNMSKHQYEIYRDFGYRNYKNLSKSQKARVARGRTENNSSSGRGQHDRDSISTYSAPQQAQGPRPNSAQQKVFQREKRLRELGVSGREARYHRAQKLCKNVPGAFCR